MKTTTYQTFKTIIIGFFLFFQFEGFSQDILVAEYNFEGGGQSWVHQAYTTIGGITTSPSGGPLTSANASLNFAPTGGTGSYRHNSPTAAGNWFTRSPGIMLTSGKVYYLKFAVRLAGFTLSANQRVQARIGTTTQINGGTIILPSQTLPSSAGTAYIEYTSGNYTALATALHYIRLADFYSNGSGWSCYFDAVRLYEVAPPASEWDGSDNNDWNNPNNWTPIGVPPINSPVIIPTGALPNEPFISGTIASISDLTLASGRILTISADAALSVSGILTNNGQINVASGGAIVQTSTSTLAGSGNYTVNRTIPSAGPNNTFRFLGSPINNITAGSFGIAATGVNGGQVLPLAGCSPTGVQSSSPFGNILELRENATPVNNCAQSLWHVKSAGTLVNGRGYTMKVNPNTTYSFSGTINNGNVVVTGLTSNSGNVNDHFAGPSQQRGWHLLANPYPSPISITALDRTSQGFLGQVQIWNPATGSFVSSVGTVIIPVGQGFQIKNTSGSTQSFTFTNAMRTTNTATFYNNEDWCNYFTTIRVSGNNYSDETTVFFHDQATDDFDGALDANKLPGNYFQPTLFTMAGAQRMSYNGLPNLTLPKTIPMNFAPGANGTFTLDFSNLETFPQTSLIFLQDLKTGQIINIRQTHTYTFTSATSDNIDRFRIRFEAPLNLSLNHAGCSETTSGSIEISNPSNEIWTAQVFANNILIANETIAANANTSLANLSSGDYMMTLSSNNYSTSQIFHIEGGMNVAGNFEVNKTSLTTLETVQANVLQAQEGLSYTWLLNGMYAGSGESINFNIQDAGVYELTLLTQSGDCSASKAVNITVNPAQTTGIDALNNAGFILYPNPAQDLLQISLNASVNFEIARILDLSGRVLMTQSIKADENNQLVTLDIRNISPGIYQLLLDGEKGRSSVKFTVVK